MVGFRGVEVFAGGALGRLFLFVVFFVDVHIGNSLIIFITGNFKKRSIYSHNMMYDKYFYLIQSGQIISMKLLSFGLLK